MDLTPSFSKYLEKKEPEEATVSVPEQALIVPTQVPTVPIRQPKPPMIPNAAFADLRTIPKERYYSPKTLRNRHIAIMEQMVLNPKMDQDEMAEQLGYTPSRFSTIVNSPLFIYAFKEYRKDHKEKISELVLEVTTAALSFEKEVIENKDMDTKARQESARDILSQGHARAVEKRANVNVAVPLPAEALAGLERVLGEMSGPFKPTRSLTVPTGNGNGSED